MSHYQAKAPEGRNPRSIKPLAFQYSIHRRRYVRNFTEIDHHDNPDLSWPWVLRMDADDDGVKP